MSTDLATEARQSVLDRLLTAAKAWSAREERWRSQGRDDAEDAHAFAAITLRAYVAEHDNPTPTPMPAEPMANHWFRDRTHSHIASTYCECKPEPALTASGGELVYIHGSPS